MVMHVAIIAGGFLSMVFGSPAALLFVLVVLKTIIDVELHLREHMVRQAHHPEPVEGRQKGRRG